GIFGELDNRFCPSFFFSSRRRHTRWPRDWSSDVCSSDLAPEEFDQFPGQERLAFDQLFFLPRGPEPTLDHLLREERRVEVFVERSEERRVGKECRSQW